MPVSKIMTFNLLRLFILIHVSVATLAIVNGYQYYSWSGVGFREINSSPDAAYTIKNLLINWWFLKGISCGFSIFIVFLGIYHHKDVIKGGWKVSIHWFLLILPAVCVFWYGWNIV